MLSCHLIGYPILECCEIDNNTKLSTVCYRCGYVDVINLC
jgi:hypothetical protein